jgi:hypothetical protein
VTATYQEASAEVRVQRLPLSHLSLELGHLYFEDFEEGPDRLTAHFEQVKPWAAAAREIYTAGLRSTPRVSTCFLIDDYFGPKGSPADILPGLVEAARAAETPIDYLVRESACADADGISLAQLVLDHIVEDPAPDTTGARPPVRDVGWLSNGKRSPNTDQAEAMTAATWRPPAQNAANRHSVFMDVQLWDAPKGERRWSCAYLASVWQLLRLGLLRYGGEPVAQPRPFDGEFPAAWHHLPAVVQLNPDAPPFSAYRAVSVLGSRFFPTEHAVRTVLSQVAVDSMLAGEATTRAASEGLTLPLEAADRVSYVFMG